MRKNALIVNIEAVAAEKVCHAYNVRLWRATLSLTDITFIYSYKVAQAVMAFMCYNMLRYCAYLIINMMLISCVINGVN